jgi:dimethylhistidine N-methyltransferase
MVQAARQQSSTDPIADFRADVLDGMSRPRKAIPPRWFYDDRGAELFKAIGETPEYYPTRTERAILRVNARVIAGMLGRDVMLVELGGGDLSKARLILSMLVEPAGFVGVDLSAEQLRGATRLLARDYPGLAVSAIAADFTRPFGLPPAVRSARACVAMFLGSSIGNFTPSEALDLLQRIGGMIGRGGAFLIGVDLDKDPAILNAAYNDAAGVTAAFNLNLLDRVNRELAGDFERAEFAHRAFYDTEHKRIEMHLVSRRAQNVRVAGREFRFAAGETIHTENSYKYTTDGFADLARAAGYVPDRVWLDPKRLFSVHLLRRP